LHAYVDANGWPQPRLMAFLQAQGNIEPAEMARTFNCGIGMAIIVSAGEADQIAAQLAGAGETVFRIGEVRPGAKGCTVSASAGIWGGRSDWVAEHCD
jgi:phosphoribosylformylglycinamidine cyclo-ligase